MKVVWSYCEVSFNQRDKGVAEALHRYLEDCWIDNSLPSRDKSMASNIVGRVEKVVNELENLSKSVFEIRFDTLFRLIQVIEDRKSSGIENQIVKFLENSLDESTRNAARANTLTIMRHKLRELNALILKYVNDESLYEEVDLGLNRIEIRSLLNKINKSLEGDQKNDKYEILALPLSKGEAQFIYMLLHQKLDLGSEALMELRDYVDRSYLYSEGEEVKYFQWSKNCVEKIIEMLEGNEDHEVLVLFLEARLKFARQGREAKIRFSSGQIRYINDLYQRESEPDDGMANTFHSAISLFK